MIILNYIIQTKISGLNSQSLRLGLDLYLSKFLTPVLTNTSSS